MMSSKHIAAMQLSLVERIHLIHQQLAGMPALDADARAYPLVQELLGLLSFRHYGEAVREILDDIVLMAITPSLRRLFATGSYLYERQSARQMLARHDLRDEITQRHPFYRQYVRSTSLEFSAACLFLEESPKRVLMAGSGPLPLTAIVLTEKFGVPVDCLDIEQEAATIAAQVADRLDLSERLQFIAGNIANHSGLERYDVILLAALAGGQRDKRRILRHLSATMQRGAVLIVRTASELRTLLYPPVLPQDFDGFDLRLGIQPYTENLHSALIAQVPRALRAH